MTEEPRLLDIGEVAQKLGCGEKHVKKLISTRQLPHVDLGTGVKVFEDDFWKWMRSQVKVKYQDEVEIEE